MAVESPKSAAYTLRTKSLQKRSELEQSRSRGIRKEPKEKSKPAPLSKYRRKTANARERSRMREINEAFETLQRTLPDLPGVDADKLTKITVLRLAVNYIKILSHVTDETPVESRGIDELRQLWCSSNAHMARPEHCVRPILSDTKLVPTKMPRVPSSPKSRPIKVKVPKSEVSTTTAVKKRPSKSRLRGKVCRTASVATSNGAYITLKNVAFQTTPNRRHDNRPLMMSMTVKRPRLESLSFGRPTKVARYEPPLPKKKRPNPQVTFKKEQQDMSCFTIYDLQNTTDLSPRLSTSPTNINSSLHSTSSDLCSRLPTSPTSFEVNSRLFFSASSPIIPTTFLNPSNFHLSDVSSRLSSTSSLDSVDTSLSPLPSASPSESLFTESEPDFGSALELDRLLTSEPFEEELNHLSSSFIDTDDTLSLFLDHSSSNFICTDINIY